MSHHSYPQKIGNWWLGANLGSGFSGSIFRATNIHTRQEVAIKLQDVDVDCPTNRYERSFYPALQGGVGMPTLWASGIEGDYDYLVIDLLGSSLDSLFRRSGRSVMDLRSVCCIAMQVVSPTLLPAPNGAFRTFVSLLPRLCLALRAIRSPDWNSCIRAVIYMIDFGFSKFYIDPVTKRHIPDSKVKRDFIGNYWFSSVAVHCRGKVPSRRDDLEAVALMLIHLLTPGGLSWTRNGVPKTNAAHDRLMREKRDAQPEDLCRGLPAVFEEFLRYCRRLKFSECPDYAHWVNEFRELAVDKGYPRSSLFVWPPPNPEPTVQVISPTKRSALADKDAVEGILNNLANLQIRDRQVLGSRKETADADRDEVKTPVGFEDIIVISSDDENMAPAAMRLPKAVQLNKLVRSVPGATDNVALARVVHDFVTVLQDSRSRTLTKEGFAFLDALYKQLADPSVYVQPLRTSRPRDSAKDGEQVHPEPRQVKQNKLWNMRRDVATAKNNKALAQLVAEFGALINRSIHFKLDSRRSKFNTNVTRKKQPQHEYQYH
ncbi:uncharacterized protein FIBRA_07136 [Fibroporia radiculosa]|uniref:Protein kinase domain-containing protein n=1 Tax=Fibroporia radiculosa TaxID=599839 RepID=J4H4G2_9APHY|nr:uncharacterized protein FIBRA_07136 [Fibroporia radiculosa]CCM04939.1 predicted protein [Fibroporia radiculosa]